MTPLEELEIMLLSPPLELFTGAALIFFGTAALALIIQRFIPALRELYVAIVRFILRLLGVKRQLQQYAQLLASACAELAFAYGLCLLPLCLALLSDTMSLSKGLLVSVLGTLITIFLMMLATLISLLITAIRWLHLRRQHQD